jgi:multimeric flavodoxin WrbA
MKITLMNASPKAEHSGSQQLIDRLIPFLKGDEYGILQVNPQMKEDLAVKAVMASDAIVIVSPIYVSSLPSSMLALMDVLEARVQKKELKVAAILQCGFYEAENTELAMELIKQWCRQNQYDFLGGIGFGGGGALLGMKDVPTGKLFLKQLPQAYEALYQSLHDGQAKENYFSIAMPKWLYAFIANHNWKTMIKAEGGSSKDLSARPKIPNA